MTKFQLLSFLQQREPGVKKFGLSIDLSIVTYLKAAHVKAQVATQTST
jgi:hypothetical protein